MSDIDEKLDQCRIGVEDIKEMRAVQDVPKLLTRFTGYVNNVSALRQYVQNELRAPLRSKTPNDAQRWLNALETDQDIAGVMGLRHIDQHKTLVRVHRRAAKFAISEYIPTSDNPPVVRVVRVGEPDPGPMPAPRIESRVNRPTEVTAEFEYFCDPTRLPDFMKAHNAMNFGRIAGNTILLAKGTDLPHKLIVQKYVAQTNLIVLAKRAYASFEARITDGKLRGILQS